MKLNETLQRQKTYLNLKILIHTSLSMQVELTNKNSINLANIQLKKHINELQNENEK